MICDPEAYYLLFYWSIERPVMTENITQYRANLILVPYTMWIPQEDTSNTKHALWPRKWDW